MDLGEPFKRTMIIQPGCDGTFIVLARTLEDKLEREVKFGFTTIDDLLIWMARHGSNARVTDVVDPERKQDYLGRPVLGMDAINGLKRTTAAKTLAERVEAMGNTPNDAA